MPERKPASAPRRRSRSAAEKAVLRAVMRFRAATDAIAASNDWEWSLYCLEEALSAFQAIGGANSPSAYTRMMADALLKCSVDASLAWWRRDADRAGWLKLCLWDLAGRVGLFHVPAHQSLSARMLEDVRPVLYPVFDATRCPVARFVLSWALSAGQGACGTREQEHLFASMRALDLGPLERNLRRVWARQTPEENICACTRKRTAEVLEMIGHLQE